MAPSSGASQREAARVELAAAAQHATVQAALTIPCVAGSVVSTNLPSEAVLAKVAAAKAAAVHDSVFGWLEAAPGAAGPGGGSGDGWADAVDVSSRALFQCSAELRARKRTAIAAS